MLNKGLYLTERIRNFLFHRFLGIPFSFTQNRIQGHFPLFFTHTYYYRMTLSSPGPLVLYIYNINLEDTFRQNSGSSLTLCPLSDRVECIAEMIE